MFNCSLARHKIRALLARTGMKGHGVWTPLAAGTKTADSCVLPLSVLVC